MKTIAANIPSTVFKVDSDYAALFPDVELGGMKENLESLATTLEIWCSGVKIRERRHCWSRKAAERTRQGPELFQLLDNF